MFKIAVFCFFLVIGATLVTMQESTAIKCRANYTLSLCGPRCEQICGIKILCLPPPIICLPRPKCWCSRLGYAKVLRTGQCLKEKDCPKLT